MASKTKETPAQAAVRALHERAAARERAAEQLQLLAAKYTAPDPNGLVVGGLVRMALQDAALAMLTEQTKFLQLAEKAKRDAVATAQGRLL
jgi:hypothetical protein